jgi:hypothetical protein
MNRGAMIVITRLFPIIIGLVSVSVGTFYAAERANQTKGKPVNANSSEGKAVHIVVRSRADIKRTFTYSPYPVIPTELEGYAGSQTGGTGTYRLSVDTHGAVTQVAVLKGFAVTAVYDERFSNLKGNPVPALDEVMRRALAKWRAKPGPPRVVDIYWSFGTQPWINYGKPNSAR